MTKKGGFTLIELLVVIMILGILAAIAVPKFMAATESARVAEAVRVLGTIREAEEVYMQQSDPVNPYSKNLFTLGVNASGQVGSTAWLLELRYWNIEIFNPGTTFNALATRKNVPTGTTYTGNTIYLNDGGIWGGTHPMRPSQTP